MKQIWDVEALSKYWSLGFEDLELLKSKPERNHIGFAIQFKYYQFTSQSPEIPKANLHYVSSQFARLIQ